MSTEDLMSIRKTIHASFVGLGLLTPCACFTPTPGPLAGTEASGDTCPMEGPGCECREDIACPGSMQCVQGACRPPDPETTGDSATSQEITSGIDSDDPSSTGDEPSATQVSSGGTSGGESTGSTGDPGTSGTGTTGLASCAGQLDFDQDVAVLGMDVDVGGVQFTSLNGTEFEIRNPGDGWGFASRWLWMWTYGNGARLTFGEPIGALRFEAGGQRAVASPTSVRVLSGGYTLQIIDTIIGDVVPVDLVLAEPTDEIEIVFEGGSISTFGIDNLEFDCP